MSQAVLRWPDYASTIAYAVPYHHSFINLYVHILHPFTLACIM